MKESEANQFLKALPEPQCTWLDRCRGDRRLTSTFVTEMGYVAPNEGIKCGAGGQTNESSAYNQERFTA